MTFGTLSFFILLSSKRNKSDSVKNYEYKPTGDQPQAIETLVKGFKEGNQCQTLLGVTDSGKTFAMANVIEQLQKPTLIIAHNKTIAGQLYSKFKEIDNLNWMEWVRKSGIVNMIRREREFLGCAMKDRAEPLEIV